MHIKTTMPALLAVSVCLTAFAEPALDEPLALSNRNPLVQIHSLPGARSGAVLPAAHSRWRLGYEKASHFTVSERGGESIVLDGETQRIELGGRYGLGNGWEVGATLPLIRHSGGGLDGFIEGWHDFWGLPDGDRPDYPRDRLAYRYARGGRTLLDFDRAHSGVGDLRLDAAYNLHQSGDRSLALAATLGLPTGDDDKLTGSGATNASVMLAATQANVFGANLSAHGNIGVFWLNEGDVLGERQRDYVGFGSAGLSWAPGESWRLKVQLEAHTAFYRSELRELGSESVQLLLGGSAPLSKNWLLDITVAEDIAVDTAPDVVFQLALRAAY